jgi:hypothetical protein
MKLAERRAMPPFGHFSLIRFRKDGESKGLTQEDTFRLAG